MTTGRALHTVTLTQDDKCCRNCWIVTDQQTGMHRRFLTADWAHAAVMRGDFGTPADRTLPTIIRTTYLVWVDPPVTVEDVAPVSGGDYLLPCDTCGITTRNAQRWEFDNYLSTRIHRTRRLYCSAGCAVHGINEKGDR